MPSPQVSSTLPRRCPCLSGLTYAECCGPLHAGQGSAPTAERLMRSRYSAFAVGDTEYLLATWHPATRPESLELDADMQWVRLDILRTVRGGPLDTDGVVEFAAHYRLDGQRAQQHETSRFLKVDRRWFYLDSLG
ncbi:MULTISPECIES: YchJ family protein [unclassified Cryobacterium]|uniref:YchJ family protein n=1 Tax=unclassified Cryobacterium TaxID=2649013 RepID=UPI001F543DCE|nr:MULTISPECIES: YchJ family protein [unclassified Cryobacterium]